MPPRPTTAQAIEAVAWARQRHLRQRGSLLYTEGLIEARDSDRRFLDLDQIYPLLGGTSREGCLDGVISALLSHVGGRTADDTALLLAEDRPHRVGP